MLLLCGYYCSLGTLINRSHPNHQVGDIVLKVIEVVNDLLDLSNCIVPVNTPEVYNYDEAEIEEAKVNAEHKVKRETRAKLVEDRARSKAMIKWNALVKKDADARNGVEPTEGAESETWAELTMSKPDQEMADLEVAVRQNMDEGQDEDRILELRPGVIDCILRNMTELVTITEGIVPYKYYPRFEEVSY